MKTRETFSLFGAKWADRSRAKAISLSLWEEKEVLLETVPIEWDGRNSSTRIWRVTMRSSGRGSVCPRNSFFLPRRKRNHHAFPAFPRTSDRRGGGCWRMNSRRGFDLVDVERERERERTSRELITWDNCTAGYRVRCNLKFRVDRSFRGG